MRRLAALLVFLSGITLLAQAPPRDRHDDGAATATISGRVVDARTHEGVRNAVVRIGNSESAIRPILTGPDGAFTFADVPAGSHVVSAWKTGYSRATLGTAAGFGRPILVDLKSGEKASGLELPLVRGGAIAGRVVDELGDPLVAATVGVDRLMRVNGRLDTVRVETGTTDDLGEYRVGGLPPGRFVVSLIAAPQIPITRADAPRSDWTKLYYPGVGGLTQAQPVIVQSGEDVLGIDLVSTLVRQPMLTLTVVGRDGGPTDASVTFGSDSGIRSMFTFIEMGGRQTETRIRIDPGEWVVYARGRSGVGMTRVSVGGDDLSASIQLGPGGRVRGRVVSDGAPLPADHLVVVSAMPTDRSIARAISAVSTERVKPGLPFELTPLFGERELRVSQLPPGFELQAILDADGRDLTDAPIRFDANVNLDDVRVVITDRVARLSGTVVDRERAAVTNYALLVFPDDPARLRNAPRWSRWVRPNHLGRFTVDLLAGDYLAAVVGADEVDDSEWSNADYLERFRDRATRVTVRVGEQRSVTLTLTGDR